ncbi:MAG TPA: alanine racemase [Thermoanaerobaculia bacterium]
MRPTCASIELDAIARNYRVVRNRIGAERGIFCVVKGNAYGHGAAEVARRLSREGASRFAVAVAEEGIALRRAGVEGEILLLNYADPADAGALRAYGLAPSLYDLRQARGFAEATRTFSDPLPVHVKLDTGMGRIGFTPEVLGAVAQLLRRSPGLRVAGTFSNLASAEEMESPRTAKQVDVLKAGVAALTAAGVAPGVVHLANSAGILLHRDTWFDAVRPGLALYGVPPTQRSGAGDSLTPALTLETRVMAVNEVAPGTALGYGGRFIAERASTIAVLPIGYHDGFRRSFSGRVRVLLRGKEVPVVGAVSMDLTLVDASGAGVQSGDRVVCLGSDGGSRVTAWDLARAADTIPYEILCGIGSRVPRVYPQ